MLKLVEPVLARINAVTISSTQGSGGLSFSTSYTFAIR